MRLADFTFCAFALLSIVCEINGFLSERHGLPPLLNFESRNVAKWGTLTQLLDNFNPQDNRTYQMRFAYNDEFYKPGAPIFILLGGEWEITTDYLEGGLLFDMAKQHNGLLCYIEHRFYGQSQPLSDWSTKSLAYLTIEQSLADAAYFIQYVRDTLNAPDSKVVVAGGSYAGDMATWMRLKYPHLVDAAWASSGPVVAQLDFPQFHQIAGDNIKRYSPQCYQIIEQASAIIASLIQTPLGRSRLDLNFNTCARLKNEFPYNEFFWSQIAQIVAGMIQYATPESIKQHCSIIINANSTDPMEKLAYWVRIYRNGLCTADYDRFVNGLGSPVIQPGSALRQWYYQVCTKFGWLQTTTTGNQPFGNNHVTVNLFRRTCNDLYGPEFGLKMLTEAPVRTNIQFGGRNKALTKVVSIHGTIDPWHWPGIVLDLHEDAPGRLVLGTAHCADMGSISPSDNEQMVAVKQFVMSSIARWIR